MNLGSWLVTAKQGLLGQQRAQTEFKLSGLSAGSKDAWAWGRVLTKNLNFTTYY